jgi:uncharacterized protein (DUF2252 family)
MPGRPDVVDRVLAFNAGREPERLRLKYQGMRESASRFFRGTCHLFYEDWPKRSPLDRGPAAWISGDLHLENFGTYKGDDRITYFDLNDFDEAVLAPCTWEVTRLVTSLFVAAASYGLRRPQAVGLGRSVLDAYAEALGRGKARRVERLVAQGLVRELLDQLLRRSRAALLARRTERRGGRVRLRLGRRALPATAAQGAAVTTALRRFARVERDPKFYRVLDVARRVAGTASLGLPRYVVLVEGKGGPAGYYLLDLKATRPSALAPRSPCRQPRWSNDGERIVTLQDRMQAVAPALLRVVPVARHLHVLRELQPSEDRVALGRRTGRRELETLMRTLGEATAWSTLRSSGRQGSATADELVEFAGQPGWRVEVLRYAQHYARQVHADWLAFRAAAHIGRVPLGGGAPPPSDED